MPPPPLDILVLADLHYTRLARHACPLPSRHSALAPVLVNKALARLRQEGVTPGLIVLLGDLVDNGDAPDAARDLLALAGELRRTGIPLLAVPGNHDGDAARVAQLFDCAPGLHRIGGYGFLLFHDARQQGETFARPAEQLAWPAAAAAAHPGVPLIALQHHPLHPDIVERYPYMLANGAAVLDSYRQAGVALSLSGHFHAGQPAHDHNGTCFATAPALAEAPCRFLHVRLDGHHATLHEHALRLPLPGLCDLHCHTEFAYCATTVNAAENIALADLLGLEGLCLVEHAFHLYFPRDYAWSYRWQSERETVDALWREPRRGRMADFRAFAPALRASRARVGLEVDLLDDGRLLLAPEDAPGWDLLVGAIHELPGFRRGVTSQAAAETLFMRDVARLLAHPLAVLAHPFRFFTRAGLAKPAHLYDEVAALLAARGVAAEINFHTNAPEPDFLRACLARGVKLALGSDAHALEEVADFAPHLRLLAEIGVSPADLPRVLFTLSGHQA